MVTKVAIIGAGRLGLSFALLCDSVGHEVHVYDIDDNRQQQIKDKSVKTSEPQIEMLLAASHLHVRSDLASMVRECDLIFLFVATPSLETGEYDHSQIKVAMNEIQAASFFVKKDTTKIECRPKQIIISCTTMPGYCAELQNQIPSELNIIYNPEFIAQGNIIHGLKHADIVLIGGVHIPHSLFELYRSIMSVPPNFKVLSHTGAEIAKIAINCYLTFKIAFANMIGDWITFDLDSKEVNDILSTIGSDSRIGNKYFGYGLPASGVCLPRDMRAMQYVVMDGTLIDAIEWENTRHLNFIVGDLINKNPNKKFPFIFNQLSYKRGVDILTESKHLELCKLLLDVGYDVIIVETDAVIELAKKELEQYGDQVTFSNGDGASSYEQRVIAAQKKKGFIVDL